LSQVLFALFVKLLELLEADIVIYATDVLKGSIIIVHGSTIASVEEIMESFTSTSCLQLSMASSHSSLAYFVSFWIIITHLLDVMQYFGVDVQEFVTFNVDLGITERIPSLED
jgi:hypothetical protein